MSAADYRTPRRSPGRGNRWQETAGALRSPGSFEAPQHPGLDLLVASLADRVADQVVEQLINRLDDHDEGYLTAEQAAEVMACKLHRIRHLTSTGALRTVRDGRRVLTKRSWIDACLEGE